MQLLSSSRSHLSTDSPALSPRHCRFISRTSETHITDPAQEDQLLSHVVIEATQDNTQLLEENDDVKDPKNKHIESPSIA